MSDSDRMLQVINNALAEQRKRAFEHTHNDDDRFFGAALIKSREGKYYISANIHLTNIPTSRDCAEKEAATNAFNSEGKDFQIAELWFMGGMGNFSRHVGILPGQVGRRNSPCGSCLDVINKFKLHVPQGALASKTLVHMLPLNDGSWRIIKDDGRDPTTLDENQVLTRDIASLLPHVTYSLPDTDGSAKKLLQGGWALLRDKEAMAAIATASGDKAFHLDELETMRNQPADVILKAINAKMVDTISTVATRSSQPIKSIKVAVVRNEDGHYFMGIALNNGQVLSMEHPESQAIVDSKKFYPDKAITDIFIMGVDLEKDTKQEKSWEKSPEAPIKVEMPDGYARDRISKGGPNSGRDVLDILGNSINRQNGANVHVLLVNNKQDFDPNKHMVQMSLRELMPYRFSSPKMDAQRLL